MNRVIVTVEVEGGWSRKVGQDLCSPSAVAALRDALNPPERRPGEAGDLSARIKDLLSDVLEAERAAADQLLGVARARDHAIRAAIAAPRTDGDPAEGDR